MIYFVFFILILICVFEFKTYTVSSILSPWIINNLIWILITGGLIFYSHLFKPLYGDFLICLLVWTVGFNLFSLLGYNKSSYRKLKTRKKFSISNKLYNIFLVISLIATPIFVYKAYMNVGVLSAEIFNEFRSHANNGDLSFGLLSRIQIFNQALLIITMLFYSQISKYKVWFVIFANLMVSLVIAEKGSILYLLAVLIYILYLRKKINLKQIAYVGIITLGLFWGMNILRAWETGSHSSFGDFLALYTLSPSVAFDQLRPDIAGYFGLNTFPAFYILINLLTGSHYPIVSKLKDFVDVPNHVNVYTIMQPFYQDWGILGVFIFACIFGFICGVVYKKTFGTSLIWNCYYIHLYYILVTGFFQDNFFISISESAQLLFMFYLFSIIKTSKKISYNLK